MLRNISKPVVQKLFYWTPLLALFVVLACDSGTDSKSSNTLSKGAPTGYDLTGEDGSSAANAIAVSGSALYEGTSLDLNTLVQNAKGDLSFFTVDSSGTETAITDPTTYKLPNEAVTIRIRAAGNGDYNSKSLYFSITLTAKGSSSFAKNGAPGDLGFGFDGSAGTFADPIVVTPNAPIGRFNLANLVTGGIGLSYASVVDDGNGNETATPIPAADVATYAPGAGEVIIKITDAGDASTVAAAPLYFKITFAAASTFAKNGSPSGFSLSDAAGTFAAPLVVALDPVGPITTFNLASLVTGGIGLSYDSVVADGSGGETETDIPADDVATYAPAAAGKVIIKITDAGDTSTAAAAPLYFEITFASASTFAKNGSPSGFSLSDAAGTFAAPLVVALDPVGPITTFNLASLVTGGIGLSYDSVVADGSGGETETDIPADDVATYAPAAAGKVIIKITDAGDASTAAATPLYFEITFVSASTFAKNGSPSGFSLSDAAGTFAAPLVVALDPVGPITTFNLASLVTGGIGLSYDSVVADGSGGETETDIPADDVATYAPAAAGKVIIKITDAGDASTAAATPLYFEITFVSASTFAKNGSPSGFSLSDAAGTFAAPLVVALDPVGPITTFNLASLVTGGIGLSYDSVVADGSGGETETDIPADDVATYAPAAAGKVIIKITDAGDASTAAAAPLYFEITFVSASTFAKNGSPSGFSLSDAAGTFAAPLVVALDPVGPITTFNLASLVTGGIGLSYDSVVADGSGGETETDIPADDVATYAPAAAGKVIIKITDAGDASTAAATPLYFEITFVSASTFAKNGSPSGFSLSDAAGTFAAPLVVALDPVGPITTFNLASLVTGGIGLSYDSVVADGSGGETETDIPADDVATYAPAAAGKVIIKITDAGDASTAAATPLYFEITFVSASTFAKNGSPSGFSLSDAAGTFAAPLVVALDPVGPITTFNLASLVTGGIGLSYDSVVADGSGGETETDIPADDVATYAPAAAGKVIIKITDAGDASTAAAAPLYFEITFASASTFAKNGSPSGFSLSDAAGTFAAPLVVALDPVGPITTFNLASLVTGGIGLSYDSVVADGSGGETETDIPADDVATYAPAAAGKVIIKITDAGDASTAAATPLYFEITFAAASTLDVGSDGDAAGEYDLGGETGASDDAITVQKIFTVDMSSITSQGSFVAGDKIIVANLISGTPTALTWRKADDSGALSLGDNGTTFALTGLTAPVTILAKDAGNGTNAAKSLYFTIAVASQMVKQADADSSYSIGSGTGASDSPILVKVNASTAFANTVSVDLSQLVKDFSGNASALSYVLDSAGAATGASVALTGKTADASLNITDPITNITLYFTIDIIDQMVKAPNPASPSSGDYILDTTNTGADAGNAIEVTKATGTMTNTVAFIATDSITLADLISNGGTVTWKDAGGTDLGSQTTLALTGLTTDTVIQAVSDAVTNQRVAETLFFKIDVIEQMVKAPNPASPSSGDYILDTTNTGADAGNAIEVTKATGTMTNTVAFIATDSITLADLISNGGTVTWKDAGGTNLDDQMTFALTGLTSDVVIKAESAAVAGLRAAEDLFFRIDVIEQMVKAPNPASPSSGDYILDTTNTGADAGNAIEVTKATGTMTNTVAFIATDSITLANLISNGGTVIWKDAGGTDLGSQTTLALTGLTTDTVIQAVSEAVAGERGAETLYFTVDVEEKMVKAPNPASPSSGDYILDTTNTGADAGNAIEVTKATGTMMNTVAFAAADSITLANLISNGGTVTWKDAGGTDLGSQTTLALTGLTTDTVIQAVSEAVAGERGAETLFFKIDVIEQMVKAPNPASPYTAGDYILDTTNTGADAGNAIEVTKATGTMTNTVAFIATDSITLANLISNGSNVKWKDAGGTDLTNQTTLALTGLTTDTVIQAVSDAMTGSRTAETLFFKIDVEEKMVKAPNPSSPSSGDYILGSQSGADATTNAIEVKKATGTMTNTVAFIATDSITLADLISNGSNVKWKDAGGTDLTSQTTFALTGLTSDVVIKAESAAVAGLRAAEDLFFRIDVIDKMVKAPNPASPYTADAPILGSQSGADATTNAIEVKKATGTMTNTVAFIATDSITLANLISNGSNVKWKDAGGTDLTSQTTLALTGLTTDTVIQAVSEAVTDERVAATLFFSIQVASQMVVQDSHNGYHFAGGNGQTSDDRVVVHKDSNNDGTFDSFTADDIVNFTSLVKDFSVDNAANLSYSTDGGTSSSNGGSITLTDVSNDINLDITDPGTGVTLYFMIDVVPPSSS